ncbi:HEAT repeat domain-containing protein [Sunxiuqinia sp. A32]|uniref:HEAT repeat domain-containing protein n=1 Tax=Sunxiuqinia sp. A32 TaxID=3461496 RepID=UPI004045A235
MTEKKQKKTDATILSNLKSSNPQLVLNTISKLKESGNSAYLPLLFDTLHLSKDEEVKKAISSLLAEIKQRDAIPMLIEAIQNDKYKNEQNLLVAACWENGMDYSNYLPLFIDLLIEKDFMTAFEAYTVIMNMSGKISQAIADKETKKINVALADAGEKEQLLTDILDFIPVFVQGIEPQSI